MNTIRDFINDLGISMTCKQVESNPLITDYSMTHWLCTISHPDGTSDFSNYYSRGSAYKNQPPILKDVLECLLYDFRSVADSNFEAWCSDLGYDTDSRKAFFTYNTLENMAIDFAGFVGNAAYQRFLAITEDDDEWFRPDHISQSARILT